MQLRLWIVLLSLVLVAGLASSGATAYFSDGAQNPNNTLATTVWGNTILLSDGFEGEPWDANWDGNGITLWERNDTKVHSGLWAACATKSKNGNVTTDDLDALSATKIYVSFWYRAENLEAADLLVQLYNGTTYNTWYDITNHSSYQANTWCHFTEAIIDSQYYKSNFRLRFDAQGFEETGETFYLDDVLITMDQ